MSLDRYDEPLWRLWYRYLWPFLYFRDVTVGSPLERCQHYRHNRAMRVHLPGFVLKWVLLAASGFALGGHLEAHWEAAIPAAGCFVAATWALLVAVILSVCWMWLARFPELQ